MKFLGENSLTYLINKVKGCTDSPLKGKKIMVIGDSMSAGLYANTNWPTILAKNTGAIITNLASSGATIAHIEGDGNNFANIVLNNFTEDTDVDYLVIMGGGNDYQKSTPIGTNDDNDGTATTLKGSLIAIIEYVLKLRPTLKIFLATTPSSTKEGLSLNDYTLQSYWDAVGEIARLYHIPFINLWTNCGLNPQISEVLNTYYYTDGIHLNDTGQYYLADKMQKYLETEIINNLPVPVASADTLGGIKVGDGLTITDGVLSTTNSSTSSTETSSSLKGKTITILGDSITTGYLANTNWTTILGENTGATIQNLASYGATIAVTGSTGNDFVNIANSNLTKLDDSDYLVILGGGSDYLQSVPIGTNDDTVYTTVKGALMAIIKAAQNYNPKMKIFISTTPSATRSGVGISDFTLESYLNAIEEVARLYHIPFINLWSNFGLNPQQSNVASLYYQSDGTHLTDEGQSYLASKMQKFLETEVLNNSYNAVTWNGYRLSVLTQSEYTSLSSKDEHTLYLIKG